MNHAETMAWWERQAPTYFTNKVFSFTRPDLIEQMGVNVDTRVLEIGFGYGRELSQFAKISDHVYGVELFQCTVDLALEELRKLDAVKKVMLQTYDGEHLPYVDGFFDLVYSCFVLQHMSKVAARNMVGEALRVTRPEGNVLMEFFGDPAYYHLTDDCFSGPVGDDGTMYNNAFTQDTALALVADLGDVVRVVPNHINTESGGFDNYYVCMKPYPKPEPVPAPEILIEPPKLPVFFAVITDRRSGSTMLGGTLNQHPEIEVSGEIFNSYAAIDGMPETREIGFGATMETFWRWRRKERPPEIKAVGTLIHRWQSEFFTGLTELTRGLHTRFICLYRDNLLRQFLSETIAMNKAVWSNNPEFVAALPKYTLNLEAFQIFVKTRYRERAEDWNFQPRVEYSLENLMKDWDSVIERLQYYVGVTPQPLVPLTQKQETRSLQEAVANYEEIAEYVRQIEHPEWLD